MTLREASSDHPSPLQLQRFADDDSVPSERRRVASHVAVCGACRERVTELRAIMDWVRGEPVPPVPEQALERVLARQRAGEGRLPLDASGDPQWKPRSHQGQQLLIGGGIAAVLFVAALLPHRLHNANRASLQADDGCAAPTTPTDEDFMTSTAFRRYIATAYSVPMAVLSACATDRPVGPLPTAPALATNAVHGAALTNATLAYRTTTMLDSSLTHSVLTRSISITRAAEGGAPFWLVASGRDTMQLDVNSLRPRRVYSQISQNEKGVSYAADLSTGHVRFQMRDGAGRLTKDWSFQLPDSELMAGGPLLLPVVMRALPLNAHWSASFEIFDPPWFFVGPFLRPRGVRLYRTIADVHVVGEDRVHVPAGTFDCWRLRVQRSIRPRTYVPDPEDIWVSKQEGWIVRSYTTHGKDDDTVDSDMVLVSVR